MSIKASLTALAALFLATGAQAATVALSCDGLSVGSANYNGPSHTDLLIDFDAKSWCFPKVGCPVLPIYAEVGDYVTLAKSEKVQITVNRSTGAFYTSYGEIGRGEWYVRNSVCVAVPVASAQRAF